MRQATLGCGVTRQLVDDMTRMYSRRTSDARFADAIIGCSGNKERAAINLVKAKRYAKELGCPVYMWQYHVDGAEPGESAGKEYIERLALLNPAQVGIFVPGAPTVLTENIAVQLAACNSTRGRFAAMVFDDEDISAFVTRIIRDADAEPGEIVLLPLPPSALLVHLDQLTAKQRGKLTADLVTEYGPCETCVTVPLMRSQSVIIGKTRLRRHGVELAFACTIHKLQSLTMDKLVISLKRPTWTKTGGARAKWESVYVALTRVRLGCNLHIVPMSEADKDALVGLVPRAATMAIAHVYDDDGKFVASKVQEAYTKAQKVAAAAKKAHEHSLAKQRKRVTTLAM